jgi:hypothetical protein
MAERKRRSVEKGGPRSRANRAWKDATNPTAKRDKSIGASTAEPRTPEGDSSDIPANDDEQPEPAPRRAQAGRQDQGLSWQTGPGSGGATQSAGRVKEQEGRSGQAGLKK